MLVLPGTVAQENPHQSYLPAAREQGSERLCDLQSGEGGFVHLSSSLIVEEELAKAVSTPSHAKPLGLIACSCPRAELTAITRPSPAAFSHKTYLFFLFRPEMGPYWC